MAIRKLFILFSIISGSFIGVQALKPILKLLTSFLQVSSGIWLEGVFVNTIISNSLQILYQSKAGHSKMSQDDFKPKYGRRVNHLGLNSMFVLCIYTFKHPH